ncbi:MAG TPA: four-helix bundle copper-binding protein [Aurantimonas sp.]|jgi:hypothetical protein|nr:four-helix bundle copper-binding protein [Aurantimonas sp.]
MQVREMIRTHPRVEGGTSESLIRCIEACYACAQTCTSCADACLGEDSVQMMAQCIRLNLDCADICAVTGSIATRQTGESHDVLRAVVGACAEACRACGEECQSHAEKHEHCRICAAACRDCEKACRDALAEIR